MNEGAYAARLGLVGVPTAAETIMLERDVRLVALAGQREVYGFRQEVMGKLDAPARKPPTRAARNR